MKLSKEEKKYWERKWGYRQQQVLAMDTDVYRYNFRDSETSDEDLYWITTRVKSINRLDLDNTLVTDAGVQYLTRLEALTELRLKGCKGVTAAAIDDLSQLKTLELLHLIGTGIDLADIAPLQTLSNLKLLLVSSGDSEPEIRQQMAVLKPLFPQCELNVNHKVYETEK